MNPGVGGSNPLVDTIFAERHDLPTTSLKQSELREEPLLIWLSAIIDLLNCLAHKGTRQKIEADLCDAAHIISFKGESR